MNQIRAQPLISAKEDVNMRWAGLVSPALQVHTTRVNTTETNKREAARWAGLGLHAWGMDRVGPTLDP